MSTAANMSKEAMGRLILEASTGMHGDVAKQLSVAWCDMASRATELKEIIEKMTPHLDEYISKELAAGAYGLTTDLELLEQARKVVKPQTESPDPQNWSREVASNPSSPVVYRKE